MVLEFEPTYDNDDSQSLKIGTRITRTYAYFPWELRT